MKTHLLTIFFLCLPILNLHAEVITDGTLGSRVELSGSDFQITADLGQQHGGNLFHSFQEFNLHSKESATFSGTHAISNIISRVTGGNPSNINGLIRSTIPNANLYFINPYGILFGANAQLDLSGSFSASSADYLRLGETGRFDARQPNNSLLTIAPPSAYGFLDKPIGNIEINHSTLIMPENQALTLVGGDITIQGETIWDHKNNKAIYNGILKTHGGNISLVSIASKGEFSIISKTLSDDKIELGKITVHDFTQDVINLYRTTANIDASGFGGGQIFIQAGQVILDNGYIFADTTGAENGKGIQIQTTNDISLTNTARITSAALVNSTGNAGDIYLAAKQINLTKGSQIISGSDAPTIYYPGSPAKGNAGNITLIAQEHLWMDGFDTSTGISLASSIFANNLSDNVHSSGGDIKINTPELVMTNWGDIRTETRGFGNAGNVFLQVDKLFIQNFAQIKTGTGDIENYQGQGKGGDIFINATDSIFISGGMLSRHSGLQSNTFTAGQGGQIEVFTPQLLIQEGAAIQTVARGTGEAGNISLATTNLTLTNGIITTEGKETGGGNITIHTDNRLYLTNSLFSAESTSTQPQDSGGNITIAQTEFTILDNSQIITRGFIGNGGNIRITAEHFIPSIDSLLDASSHLGIDGEITIDAPDSDLTGSLAILPKTFFDASQWLRKHCANNTNPNRSLLKTTKREGILKVFGIF